MNQEKKQNFNFLRKIWHLLGLIIPLALFFDVFDGSLGLQYATRAIIVVGLFIALVVLVILEFFRFRFEGFSEFFWKVFGPLMKEGERESLNATVPYFIANLIVVLFFPAELAVLSLSFLVIGDPTAAFIGSHYGRHRLYNGKSIEGILAFILSSTLFGLILIWMFPVFKPDTLYGLIDGRGNFNISIFVLLFLGSLTAGITEFFSGTTWKGLLDDNLLIPIVSCFVMGMISIYYLGFPVETVFFDPGLLFQ